MKNTRKKMLLSSIAMLLVALIALGSATFAWYINQTTVTAKNATVSASVASGLEIRKFNGAKLPTSNPADDSADWLAWDKTINLSTESGLAPASINYADNLSGLIYASGGEGTDYDNGTLKTGTELTEVTSDYSNFIIDHFQVASSNSDTPSVNWRIDNVNAPDNTYVAFAIYKGTDLIASYTSGTKDSGKVNGTTGDIGHTTYTHDAKLVSNTNISQTAFNVGTKAAPTNFTVIGFVDGFDDACTSHNARNDQVKISLSFSKDPF